MIGAHQIQLGTDQFITGMASSDYATDGVLGIGSHDVNPFKIPGAIAATVIPNINSTHLADNIIATCEDGTGNLNARLAVGDAGNFYTFDTSGNITKQATASTTTGYQQIRTDMEIQSGGSGNYYAFVTRTNDITLWNGSTGITEEWWTNVAYYTGTTHPPALNANVPHCLLNYNTNLWVSDGSQLHNIIPNTAFTTATLCVNLSVLSLDLYTTIYALGIDPATGLMLISFQDNVNQGDPVSSKYFVGLYDGFSTGLVRKIPVDDLVTSFRNVGGVVYVGFGRRLGIWNGNGITFLRQLQFATLGTSSTLPYKHHMSNIANILLVVDGAYVLAYGEPIANKPKTFWYLSSNQPSNVLTNIETLFSYGNTAGLAYATNACATVDITAASGSSNSNCLIGFNSIFFPRPVYIRRMRLITNGVVATAGTNIVVSILSEKNVVLPISNANRIVTVTATTYVFDFDFTAGKCQAVQPMITFDDAPTALLRAYLYYDIAE